MVQRITLPDKDHNYHMYGILMVLVESRVGGDHARPSPEVSIAPSERTGKIKAKARFDVR